MPIQYHSLVDFRCRWSILSIYLSTTFGTISGFLNINAQAYIGYSVLQKHEYFGSQGKHKYMLSIIYKMGAEAQI